MRPNWLPLPNRFSLSVPPDSFLDDLAAYDPDLRIFPSQEDGVFRVGRVVPGNLPPVYHFMQHRPDTKVYVANRLVPVTSIVPTPFVQWGPVIINDLAERDIRAVGGWESACRLIEDREESAERKERRDVSDEASIRARSAWRAIKWRTGQTIDLGAKAVGSDSRNDARRRRATYRPLGFASGSAAFVGRTSTPARNRAAFIDTDTFVNVAR
jgi:hypothetical protein